MKVTRLKVLNPQARASMAVCVVACLCFSVGEGLRLTPLPALQLAPVNSSGLRVGPLLSRGVMRRLSGPLNLPANAQAQKRGKRQTPDCECPAPTHAREITLYPHRRSSAGRQFLRASLLSDARPPGRAPPLIS